MHTDHDFILLPAHSCVCVLSLYNRYHHNAYFMQQAGEVVRRKNINLFERFIQFAFDKQDGKVTLLTPEDKSKPALSLSCYQSFLKELLGSMKHKSSKRYPV